MNLWDALRISNSVIPCAEVLPVRSKAIRHERLQQNAGGGCADKVLRFALGGCANSSFVVRPL